MKRVLTAFALLIPTVYAVFWAPHWGFFAVVTAVALLCYEEYRGLVVHHDIEKPHIVSYGLGLLMLVANPVAAATLTVVTSLLLGMRARDLRKALPLAAATGVGVMYVFGAWRCALELRLLNPWWLFFALAANWTGDVAAYYFGRMFGKHKLAPRVSPGKSWEGSIASALATLGFGVLFFGRFLPQVPVWQVVLYSLVGNVAGQMGDLTESAIKRGAGVKDSGHLLPGHGGWLDRLDSSLFTLPVIYALHLLMAAGGY